MLPANGVEKLFWLPTVDKALINMLLIIPHITAESKGELSGGAGKAIGPGGNGEWRV